MRAFALLLVFAAVLAACSTPATGGAADGKVQLVATTTIAGDVVRQVAGDRFDVQVLLPVGADPHSFQPSPQDITIVSKAAAVFIVGTGLEDGFITSLIENAGAKDRVVNLSDGITLRQFSAGESTETASGGDPHVWWDPNNVLIWTNNIETALKKLDPEYASDFEQRANAYREQLQQLDTWIQQQVQAVPQANRQIVTDHAMLGYFADRYGFTQAGTVIPSYSTSAQPSAQQLAQLEDSIRSLGVKAVLVGNTVNTNLAQRVAEDTGVQLVPFYTDSLSDPSGPAGTYLDYMRSNVEKITTALR
jgi:ABC-type Zn uptake system ZnuABC Zn-binding protein ZnuA